MPFMALSQESYTVISAMSCWLPKSVLFVMGVDYTGHGNMNEGLWRLALIGSYEMSNPKTRLV